MLMARVNGLGRLIPTPALNKIMLHRVVGGLVHLNCTLYLYNGLECAAVWHVGRYLASRYTAPRGLGRCDNRNGLGAGFR